MMILDLERSGRHLISTKNYINTSHLVVFRWDQNERMVWVRLLGYCGYGISMDLLRKSLTVDVC